MSQHHLCTCVSRLGHARTVRNTRTVSCRVAAMGALAIAALSGCGGGGDGILRDPPADPVVIGISPPNTSVNVGEGFTFAVQLSGGSRTAPPTLASCASSNAVVATSAVQGSGCRVTAISAGTVAITATASTGQAAAASLTVTPAPDALTGVTLSPVNGSVAVGQTLPLTPTPTQGSASVSVSYAYSTSATSIASVNASTGVVTGVAPGSATITVMATGSGAGFTTSTRTANVTVTVAQDALTAVSLTGGTVNVGQTLTLTPTPTRASAAVTVSYVYATNAPSVATVNASTGVVTGVAPGSATITVTATGSGSGFTTTARTATALVTVTSLPNAMNGVTLAPTTPSVAAGQTVQLTPTPARASAAVAVSYTYTTSSPSIAIVNASGVVTGVAPGTATITVFATGSGIGFATNQVTATASVSVTTACQVVIATIPLTTAGQLAGSSCQFLNSPGPAVQYRITLAAQAAVLLSATGGVSVAARPDALPTSNIFFGGGIGRFLLPVGTSTLFVGSLDPSSAAFTFSATPIAESLDNCASMVLSAPTLTTQILSSTDCVSGASRYDRADLFIPGRSCTIDVLTVIGGLADPYLEVWNSANTAIIAENDDGGGGFQPQLTFPNCVGTDGSILRVRVRGFDPADFGSYRVRITVAQPGVGTSDGETPPVRAGKERPVGTPMPQRADSTPRTSCLRQPQCGR